MDKTIFIIGDSPFLGEIEDKIHYITEKYPTIGINNAVRKYKVSTHVFQDMKFVDLTNQHPEVKTVTIPAWGDMIIKDNKELYDSFTFNFKVNTKDDVVENNKLAWCGFTHDYAISYCIMKGYSRIILVGAADFTGNKHYLTDEEFKYSEKLRNNSKRFIEDVCSKKASILTCNTNSILDVLRASIDEFLK